MAGPRNRVTSIGLELEGGWATEPPGLKHDGSVRGVIGVTGEISSRAFSTVALAEEWMRRFYPQSVNSTCGFHVHVGLPPLHYSRLMDENFNLKFLAAMEDFWSRYRAQPGFDLFRTRLDGQNRYCQKNFRPEAQLWQTAPYGNLDQLPRYSQLNFCFGRHGTLECRLFPCFENVEHSIEGMKTFIASVNEFLATCKPERPLRLCLTSDEVDVEDVDIPQRRPARA